MRILIGMSLFVPAGAIAALAEGKPAPDFTTQAANAGKPFQFSLGKALRKGPVVLYFFPAAFTPGCTVEANQFADASPEFRKMGASVVGMSADDIATLVKFSKTECRSKFAVAVASPTMVAAYDVRIGQSNRSNRTSYVIAPDGKIIYAYSSPDYRDHVKNTVAAVRNWRLSSRKRKGSFH